MALLKLTEGRVWIRWAACEEIVNIVKRPIEVRAGTAYSEETRS